MATNTYIALDKVTVGSAVSSITFNSINQTYTDLFIVANIIGTVDSSNIRMTFNGDSSALYSPTWMAGSGSSATSGRDSGQTSILLSNGPLGSGSSTSPVVFTASIQSYTNTNVYKNVLSRYGTANATYSGTIAQASLYRSLNAITSITMTAQSTTFAIGSTFSLYGIAAEGTSPAPKATGGAVYSDSTYYYHVFGASGTFTPTQSITADVLCVAGGGGGGSRAGGGGGAGGVTYYASQSLIATGYTCTVGSGGAGGGGTTTGGIGSSGGNSQFGGLTASVGGGWGIRWLSAVNVGAAGSGGSGGGATMTANGTTSTAGAGTSGQGYAGGGQSDNAAGGGGAGGAGNAGNASKSGDGGVGSATYSSWGIATGVGQNVNGTYYLAGGGGGGSASNTLLGGSGGYGGGGNGNNGITTNNPTGNGQFATGGGGGGAGNNNDSASVYGGNGGSGVVIIRYAK